MNVDELVTECTKGVNIFCSSSGPSTCEKLTEPSPMEHRISCHRCGNIRKKRILCSRSNCPHTFCGRCFDKMKEEYGSSIFINGCPVCKDLCCCNNKSVYCHRINHCYRKCPASKSKPNHISTPYKENEHVESSNTVGTDNPAENCVFDLLLAVADMRGKEEVPDSLSVLPILPASGNEMEQLHKKQKWSPEPVVQPLGPSDLLLQRLNDLYPISSLSSQSSQVAWRDTYRERAGSEGMSAVPTSSLFGPMTLSTDSFAQLSTASRRCEDAGVDGYTFNRESSIGIRVDSELGFEGFLGGVTRSSSSSSGRGAEQQSVDAHTAHRNKVLSTPRKLTDTKKTPPSQKALVGSSTVSTTSPLSPTAGRGSSGTSGMGGKAIDLLALVSSYSSNIGPA